MLRLLPYFVELVLLVVCLIDAIQTPEISMRNLPKWAWLALIVLIPIVGPVAWLVAGRPRRGTPTQAANPSPSRGYPSYQRHTPMAPDDDQEFLASLKRETEHQAELKKWEADLKRREEDLRKREPDEPAES